jgi:hypothetical protein
MTMIKYWCAICELWSERHEPLFFSPCCEECGAFLEKEPELEPYEVEFREVDISHKFSDQETEDIDADTESEDADAETEAEPD